MSDVKVSLTIYRTRSNWETDPKTGKGKMTDQYFEVKSAVNTTEFLPGDELHQKKVDWLIRNGVKINVVKYT